MAHNKANEMTNNIEVALLGETTMHVREREKRKLPYYTGRQAMFYGMSLFGGIMLLF